MDKDRVVGGAKQAKGAAKEAIGRGTGSKPAEAEGTAEKTKGKVQRQFGRVKDTIRGVFKR